MRDKLSKKTALRALSNNSMDAILDFLVSTWQELGRPKRLKMDNCLDFRGSNLYPRSPSKLVRVCLDLGVRPVFVPLREPWRNGVVENLYPPTHYNWRTHNLQLLKGNVTFIRFVRKSGRITVTAKDKFLVGKKYKWQYVLAVVDVAKKRLNIIWQDKRLKSFDYS